MFFFIIIGESDTRFTQESIKSRIGSGTFKVYCFRNDYIDPYPVGEVIMEVILGEDVEIVIRDFTLEIGKDLDFTLGQARKLSEIPTYEYLIERGLNVENQFDYLVSNAHHNSYMDILKWLYGFGYKISIATMHNLIIWKRYEATRYIVDNAMMEADFELGPNSIIETAIRAGDDYLIERYLGEIKPSDSEGSKRQISSHLYEVLKKNRFDLAGSFLQLGADINDEVVDIASIIKCGDIKTLEFVLTNGFIFKKKKMGSKFKECLEDIHENMPKLRLMIGYGLDINGYKNRVLRGVSTKGSLKDVKEILRLGAKVCFEDVRSIIMAVGFNSKEVVQLLIDCGSNVNAIGWKSGLRVVELNIRSEMADLLIKNGADFTYDSHKLIKKCVRDKNTSLIEVLMSHGEDLSWARDEIQAYYEQRYRNPNISFDNFMKKCENEGLI